MSTAASLMVEADNLTFTYLDSQTVFQEFNWQVAEGQAWSILGPSGCGKSTLLYLLAGLRQPTSGQVRVRGEPIGRPRPRTGLILQDFGLLPWATVFQNASLGLRIRGFYGPDGTHAPRDEEDLQIQQRVSFWLDRLGLAGQAGSYPSQVSGGQRQRVAIARTLALSPDLLLMDEPLAALDAPTREGLQDLILDLRREHGLTTILVTHSIEEAALMGQHVMVLGDLPNRDPVVLSEPAAASAAFRGSHGYTDRVKQLRLTLEAAG
ncbi:MAG TPA: ABC transporter ATP-binding protein [Anaerolineales bacterium]|jgi:NitT/TauT family transport system ATP-binding protein